MTCINDACMRKEKRKAHSRIVGRMGATQGSCIGRDLTQQAGQPSYDRSITDDAIVHGTRIQQGLALATARGSLALNHFSVGRARRQTPGPNVVVEVMASIADHITPFLSLDYRRQAHA